MHEPLDNAQHDQRPPRGRCGEAGYALVELVMVTSLLLVVLTAILALGETSQRVVPKETERAQVIQEAQIGLHRMTKELRQAYLNPTVTANTMQADVLTAGTTRTVSYECNQPHPSESAYTRCLRYIVSGGVKSGGEVIVDRVLNGGASATNPVFATSDVDADGRIDYVKVVVEVAARGDLKSGYEHRVVLEDAIYMRNRDG